MTTAECDKQLHEKGKILRWLIMGSGIHCIPMTTLSVLTKEWICENYNMELSYFEEKIN